MEYYEKAEVQRLAEIERRRRRQQRITQVRQQTNTWVANSRQKLENVKSLQLKELISEVTTEVTNEAIRNLENLSRRHDDTMSEIGAAHRAAANYPDYHKIKELNKVDNDKKAKIRYAEAIKKAKGDQYELEKKTQRLQRIRESVRAEEDLKSKSLVERRPFQPRNVETKPEALRAKLKKEGYQQSLAKSLYVPGKSPPVTATAGIHRKLKPKKRQRRYSFHNKENIVSKKKEGLFSVVAAAREEGASIEPMQRYVKRHSPAADQKIKPQKPPKSPEDVIYVNANIPLPPQKYKPPAGLVVKSFVDPTTPSAWDKAKIVNQQQEEEGRKLAATKRMTEKKRKERGAKAIKIARLKQRYNKLATDLMTIDEVDEEHTIVENPPPPQVTTEFGSRVKEQYDQLLAASVHQMKSLMGEDDEDNMDIEKQQVLPTSTKVKDSSSRQITVPVPLPDDSKPTQSSYPPVIILRGAQKKPRKVSFPMAEDPVTLPPSQIVDVHSKLPSSTLDPNSPHLISVIPVVVEPPEVINTITTQLQQELEKERHREDYVKLKEHLLALEEELKRRDQEKGNETKEEVDEAEISSGTVSMSDLFSISQLTPSNNLQQQPEVIILQGPQKMSRPEKSQIRKVQQSNEGRGKENIDPVVVLKGPTLKLSANQEQFNRPGTSKGAAANIISGPTRVTVKKSKKKISEQQRKRSNISSQGTSIQPNIEINNENLPKVQKLSKKTVSTKEGTREITAEASERTIRHYIGKLLSMRPESVSALQLSKSLSSTESGSSLVQVNSSAVSTSKSCQSTDSNSFRRPLRPHNNQSPYTSHLIGGSQHSNLLLSPQDTSTPLKTLVDRKSQGGENDSPGNTSTLSSNFPEVNVNVIYDTSDTFGSVVEPVSSDQDLRELLAGLCVRQVNCLSYSPPKDSQTPERDPSDSPNDSMSTLGPRFARLLRIGQRTPSQENSDDGRGQRSTSITNRTEMSSRETRRRNGSSEGDEFQLSNSPLGISQHHREPIPAMLGRVADQWAHITIERPNWSDADSSLDKEN